MALYPDTVGPVMQGFLDCVTAALNDAGRGVALSHLAPGAEVAWDNCCEGGGQAYVRLIDLTPTGQQANCPPTAMTATLGIGVIRCAHVLDDEGNAPTATQMTADALGITKDATTLYGAIVCCGDDVAGVQRIPTIGSWTPQGPQGGCAGGEWAVTVILNTCGCS